MPHNPKDTIKQQVLDPFFRPLTETPHVWAAIGNQCAGRLSWVTYERSMDSWKYGMSRDVRNAIIDHLDFPAGTPIERDLMLGFHD